MWKIPGREHRASTAQRLSSKRSEARKDREGRQRETGVRGAAELNGEAYTESLLSI